MDNFTVGVYNVSAAAAKNRPDKVLRDLEFMIERCHVVTVLEAGHADRILTDLQRKTGVRIYDDDGQDGKDATPILVRKGVPIAERKTFSLTPRTYVGPAGAGPSTLKNKWLHCVQVEWGGRRIWVASIHASPSVYIPVRRRLVSRQYLKAALIVSRLRGPAVIGGDWNTQPDDALRNIVERRGFKFVQATFKKLPTMGRRAIDDIAYKKNLLSPVRRNAYSGTSDHKMFVVEFKLVNN